MGEMPRFITLCAHVAPAGLEFCRENAATPGEMIRKDSRKRDCRHTHRGRR